MKNCWSSRTVTKSHQNQHKISDLDGKMINFETGTLFQIRAYNVRTTEKYFFSIPNNFIWLTSNVAKREHITN